MKGTVFMRNNNLIRKDDATKTTDELLNSGWVFLDAKYEALIRGMLNVIRNELDRNYWNENQQVMDSPFDNTGAMDFTTDYITIRSYNWDENELPNLDTDQLKVFWYKHSSRGVMAMVKTKENIGDIFAEVLNNSIESINQSFKKKGEI